MPSSSYFTWPLDDFNHHTPSISNISPEFYSKSSIRFPQVHRKFKNQSHFPSRHLTPFTALNLPLGASGAQAQKIRGTLEQPFFIAPIKMVTEHLESTPPIHSHSHCLIQGLNQLYQFLRLLFSPASDPIAVSFTVQSKIQTT